MCAFFQYGPIFWEDFQQTGIENIMEHPEISECFGFPGRLELSVLVFHLFKIQLFLEFTGWTGKNGSWSSPRPRRKVVIKQFNKSITPNFINVLCPSIVIHI